MEKFLATQNLPKPTQVFSQEDAKIEFTLYLFKKMDPCVEGEQKLFIQTFYKLPISLGVLLANATKHFKKKKF